MKPPYLEENAFVKTVSMMIMDDLEQIKKTMERSG